MKKVSFSLPKEFLPLAPEEFIPALNGDYRLGNKARLWAKASGLIAASAEEYEEANRRLVMLLRSYTDVWLATGVSFSGVEIPQSRSSTFAIHEIVRTYLYSHPALAFVSPDGYVAAVPFRIDEDVPIDWNTARTKPEKTPYGPARRLVPGGTMDDPFVIVKPLAKRFFVAMLFTNWCKKLAKCRRKDCGRYYLLSKPRPIYKRGTMCPACNRHGTATKRVAQVRAERSEERLRLAGAALKKWNSSSKGRRNLEGDVKQYINEFVNTRTGYDDVTVKWVTRNWVKIQQRNIP